MKICKSKELNFSTNDIYIFESLGVFFLINNNNNGLSILNAALEVLTTVSWKQEVYIYSVLKKKDQTELMLYCPDENYLIWVNLEGRTSFIVLTNIQGIISPFYTWIDNSLFFSTYEEKFYELNVDTKRIIEVLEHDFAIKQSNLYSLRAKALRYNQIYQVDPYNLTFIGAHEKNITFVDDKHNDLKTLEIHIPSYHDIIYANGFFCFIAEDHLIIAFSKDILSLASESDRCMFLRARFFIEKDTTNLFVLINDKSDNNKSMIVRYAVDCDNHD